MTVGSGRRLRVVPPLPGQLSLNLPGIPPPDQLAEFAGADAARPGPPPPGPAVAARVPVGVYAVWDAEDLVGVYADESVARGDAAVLRRDPARSGHRGQTVDCLPLQVFTESQHTHR